MKGLIERKYSAICACDQKGVIGYQNQIPWSIPKDLKHFKNLTQKQAVIMGKKTWQSMGNKPLNNRINIVLTRKEISSKKINQSLYFCQNLLEVDALVSKDSFLTNKKLFVIGGEEIFREYFHLNAIKEVFLSFIKMQVDYGDRYFPLSAISNWHSQVLYEDSLLKILHYYNEL